MFLAVPPLFDAFVIVNAPVFTALGVIVKLPLDAPVNVPVPNVTASALSSQPINTLASLPLSITKPASPEAEPLLPVPNSISWSSIVVFVEELVTVEPLTVKSPDRTKFAKATLSDVPTACPIDTVDVAPSPEPLTEIPVPALTAAI